MSVRAFRFGVNLMEPAPAREWHAKCRRAEELGYDVLLVPDHLGFPAPFSALVAAAGATERPRLGTFVLNTGFWNPTLLAREAASADALTGGRLELGLGTGYVPQEHATAGLPFGSPRERVDHLRDTAEVLERLLSDTGHRPAPAQRRVPLLIGANGDRVLRLTARYADIAAFTGARTSRDDGSLVPLGAADLDGRVAAYRRFAAGRPAPAELNLLLQHVSVTDDPGAAVADLVSRLPGFTEERVLDLPVVLAGTVAELADRVRGLRERYGFSYLTVLEPFMEAFAPVMEALRDE